MSTVKKMYETIRRNYWNIAHPDTGFEDAPAYSYVFPEYCREARERRAAKLKKKLTRKCPFKFEVHTTYNLIFVTIYHTRRKNVKFNEKKALRDRIEACEEKMEEVMPL